MEIDKNNPPHFWGINSDVHLDFGCGLEEARNPFQAGSLWGADILNQPGRKNYLKTSSNGKLRFGSSKFDSISAYDVIEHLTREGNPNSFITFMNEAYRLLKPNGILICVTPAFPNATVFQDPTHVNIITDQTINYFVGNNAGAKTLGYGFEGNFEILKQFWATPRCRIRERSWNRKISLISITLQILRNPVKLRLLISNSINPSHLVWVLRKV